jgi:hypothetical protein
MSDIRQGPAARPRVKILYEACNPESHRQALALERRPPADFAVSLAQSGQGDAPDSILGDDGDDLLFVLPRQAKGLRLRLRAMGRETKVVRLYWAGWPRGIADIYEAYEDSDWLVFNQAQAWEGAGRLPRTSVIRRSAERDADGPCAEYFDLFRSLLSGGADRLTAEVPDHSDLENEVTVFVSTVGSHNLASCLAALGRQDCKFRLEMVENVAPMSAAFQQMLDRCETPYYIQVDEDMLLHPNAVRTLWKRIRSSTPNTAAWVGTLFDAHLGRLLRGVKIFKHKIARRYPFRDVRGCDLDQLTRAEADGFAYVRAPLDESIPDGRPLGLHHLVWTRREAYERYFLLECKKRRYPGRYKQLRADMISISERFRDEGAEEDFFAVMGSMAGRLANDDDRDGEKDFQHPRTLPGFEGAEQLFESMNSGDHSRVDLSNILIPSIESAEETKGIRAS